METPAKIAPDGSGTGGINGDVLKAERHESDAGRMYDNQIRPDKSL